MEMDTQRIKTRAIRDLGLRNACLYSYLCYKQKYFGSGNIFYQRVEDIITGCGLTPKQIREGGKDLVELKLITMGSTTFKKNTYFVSDESSGYNPFVSDETSSTCLTKGQAQADETSSTSLTKRQIVSDESSDPTTTESVLLNQHTTKSEATESHTTEATNTTSTDTTHQIGKWKGTKHQWENLSEIRQRTFLAQRDNERQANGPSQF